MKAEIKLELKATHFKGTEYTDEETDCAVEKAYKDLTKHSCSESPDLLKDFENQKSYKHEYYSFRRFIADKKIAEFHNFDETVIREINLIEI